MAVAACNLNAPTPEDHHNAAMHTPLLLSYRADYFLEQPEQRVQWLGQLPSFCRPKTEDDRTAGHVTRTVDWTSVRRTSKNWLKNPMNIALLLWLVCVGTSGGMLVLLLLGLLDGAFPTPAARNRWIEINNQLLNALFTLMSIYQHPALCHHLFLLCRWRPGDAAVLRAAYCKDGGGAAKTPRPGERAHMAVVVALLHLTVACQYVLCGLYWGYTRSTRPELVEDGFFVLGVVAPVVAAVYTVCSPLGKVDQCELLTSDAMAVTERATATPIGGHVVIEPEWAGGMFDCGGGDAAATGCLSLSCTFCVFGWNMERLGLGNRYVHAVTFALLCFAPLWVFGVSALHIHNYVIGDAVGGAGVLLCACGLLYGGYWRIQMRKRFGLPGSRACCGSKSLTDYARWLFCWPCALAQEVRTASLYHVDGESFFSTKVVDDGHDESQPLLKCSQQDVSCARDTVVAVAPNDHHLVVVHDEAMVPPAQVVVVQVEDNNSDECCVVHEHGEMNNLREKYGLSSAGSWRVEKLRRLINMVTVVSLLVLLYTRGFIL